MSIWSKPAFVKRNKCFLNRHYRAEERISFSPYVVWLDPVQYIVKFECRRAADQLDCAALRTPRISDVGTTLWACKFRHKMLILRVGVVQGRRIDELRARRPSAVRLKA